MSVALDPGTFVSNSEDELMKCLLNLVATWNRI